MDFPLDFWLFWIRIWIKNYLWKLICIIWWCLVSQRNTWTRPYGFKNLSPSNKPATVTRQLTKSVEFCQNYLCDLLPRYSKVPTNNLKFSYFIRFCLVGQSEESSLAVKVLKVLAFGKSLPGSLDYALAIRQPNSSVWIPIFHDRWQCKQSKLWKVTASLPGLCNYN